MTALSSESKPYALSILLPISSANGPPPSPLVITAYPYPLTLCAVSVHLNPQLPPVCEKYQPCPRFELRQARNSATPNPRFPCLGERPRLFFLSV